MLAELTDEPARQIAFYESRKQKLLELTVQAEALRSQLENRSQSQAGDFGDALAVLIARATASGINQDFTASEPGRSGDTSTPDIRSPDFSYQLP